MEIAESEHLKSSDALRLIGDYDSNDSSESEQSDLGYEQNTFSSLVKNENKLPLPSVFNVLSNKSEISDAYEDKPELHDGRIRSFAHQRGNWCTYVYIPFCASTAFKKMCKAVEVIGNQNSIVLKPIHEPHVSLTRTVVLMHHWIELFVQAVRDKLSNLHRFFIQFGRLAVYCNEENTRTFLGLTIDVGDGVLLQSVKDLDECLAEFKLPAFYKNPSFHLSIAWALGDRKEQLERILSMLEEIFQTHLSLFPELGYLNVTQYICKAGNKMFSFDLK